MEFDKYLKSIPRLKALYDRLLDHMVPYLRYMIIDTNYFFKFFWLYPRMILLTALFLDVMLFRQFHYKYIVITVGILLFLNRYFKHSLKTTKQELITYYSEYISSVPTAYVPYVLPYEKERLAEDENYDPFDDDEYEVIPYMDIPFEGFIEFATELKCMKILFVKKRSRFVVAIL